MTDRPAPSSFEDNIMNYVQEKTDGRLGERWGKFAQILYKVDDRVDKLPIVISKNNPQPFTPDNPVIIPLMGNGSLEIGRIQEYYMFQDEQEIGEEDILVCIHAPSHRIQDQDVGKTLDCEITLSPFGGGVHGIYIELLHQNRSDPTNEEKKQLGEAKRFMALFDP